MDCCIMEANTVALASEKLEVGGEKEGIALPLEDGDEGELGGDRQAVAAGLHEEDGDCIMEL